jgi:hypothetical protein
MERPKKSAPTYKGAAALPHPKIEHWKVWLFVIAVILLLWSASALSESALSESESDEGAPFAFGDNCEILEQLAPEQLKSLTDFSNRGYWRNFCRINNSENCDQYSYLFEDIGELTWVNDSDGMCQFIRRHTMQEDGPTIFPNFGSYLPKEDLGPYFPMEKFGVRPPE